LVIAGIAVLAQLQRQFLGLALGHLPAARAGQMPHRRIERASYDLLCQHLPQPMGVLVGGQIERRIQGEHALQPPPPIAPADDHHLPEAALQSPLTACAPVCPAQTVFAHHAFENRLLGTSLVQIPLGQAAQQLVAFGSCTTASTSPWVNAWVSSCPSLPSRCSNWVTASA